MKIKNVSAFLCAALAIGCASFASAQTPPLPVIPSGTYYVTNYGALGNGTKDDTTNIQNAINAASTAGVGTVEITPGTFESGPLTFASSMNLQIDSGAMLQMLPFSKYPGGGTSPTNFLSATTLTDIELSGTGTIDGQGVAWWNNEATNGGTAPQMVMFSRCTRVLIQNLTLSNSPIQFIGIKNTCTDVTIQNINETAPGNSPNTDGIDVEATNVLISGCSIANGDDCIAVKGGTSITAASSSILITNCALYDGHGISLGSSIVGGISNMTVISCTFSNTQYGIRLKSDRTEGGVAQNLLFLNLQMTNVYTGIPFLLYSYYDVYSTSKASPALAASDPAQSVTSPTPIWRNITFSNITSVSMVAPGAPILIWGLPEMLVSNVTFNNVNITGAASCGIYNASGVQFINSTITLPGGTNTFQLYDAQLTLTNSAPSSPLVTINGLTTNSIGNTLAFYNAQAGLCTTNVIEPPTGPLALGGSTTFTISNSFKMVSGTVLDYILGTNTTEAAVIGNLTMGGTINVASDPGFGPGTNTLLTYTGSLNGSLPTLGTMPANYTGSINTNTAGLVELVVQTNSGGSIVLTPAPILWLPFEDSLIDYGTSTNVHYVIPRCAARFDQGCGTFIDPVSSYDGQPTNIVANATCGTNSLALFGDGSFILVTNVSDINFNTNNPFTVCAWIRINLEGTVVSLSTTNFNPNGSKARNMTLYVGNPNETGKSYGYLILDSFFNNQVVSTVPVTNGWTHVAAVYDGTNGYLYINGKLNTNSAWTGCNEGTHSEGPWSFTVGASLNTVSLFECDDDTFPSVASGDFKSSDSMNGEVDEVAVYNSALTAAQIASVCTNGVGVADGSGEGMEMVLTRKLPGLNGSQTQNIAPMLNISLSGGGAEPAKGDATTFSNGNVILSWAGTGYVLQQNSSLSPAGWTNVPDGSNGPVSVAIGTGAQFFRLVPQ